MRPCSHLSDFRTVAWLRLPGPPRPGGQADPAAGGASAALAQLRRFLGAGGRRKLRYARLLTEAVSEDRIPRPLAALLTAV